MSTSVLGVTTGTLVGTYATNVPFVSDTPTPARRPTPRFGAAVDQLAADIDHTFGNAA
jgi:hypothetical protein